MNWTRRTRIEGTLEEPLDLSVALGLNLARLILENVNELAADELALLFGVVHALKTSEELLPGVNDRQVDSKLLLENLLDLLALVQSHAAVVDENGVESVANGLCHQLRGNGRVDTAADSTEHLAIRANERTNALNLLTNEFRHRPLLLGAADAHSEVLQQLSTLRSVYRLLECAPLWPFMRLTCDLWVKLDAIDRIRLVRNGRVLRVLRSTDSVKALGQVAELVTVRHPNGHIALDILEELINVTAKLSGLQISMAVFPRGSGNNVIRVQAVGELLETVADTQDWDAKLEECRVGVGCTLFVDGVWAA